MPRILVVDDEEKVRRMIVRTLERHGLEALPAGSTKEACAALASPGIDAVILDIVLGLENGWETLRQLRESSAVPIILMSGASVDDEVRLDAEKLGAQGVLQKPFGADQLMACLAGLLKGDPGR
jgi:DNA-binding response OmpR family regulator